MSDPAALPTLRPLPRLIFPSRWLWRTVIHSTLVFSAIARAFTDRLSAASHEPAKH